MTTIVFLLTMLSTVISVSLLAKLILFVRKLIAFILTKEYAAHIDTHYDNTLASLFNI